MNADILELQPVKPYPTGKVSKFFWGGKSSSFKEKPQLKEYSFHAEDYDTVIVGSPLWACQVAPPLRTFLMENDLSGKRVAAFISCGGGDTAKAFADIRQMAKRGSLAAELKLVNPLSSREATLDAVKEFCNKLNQE